MLAFTLARSISFLSLCTAVGLAVACGSVADQSSGGTTNGSGASGQGEAATGGGGTGQGGSGGVTSAGGGGAEQGGAGDVTAAGGGGSGGGGAGGVLADAAPPPFPVGDVYVAGSRNAEVFEYDAALQLVSHWIDPHFGTLEAFPGQDLSIGPAGMVFDESGNLVVAAQEAFCVFSAPNQLIACHPKFAPEATENVIFDRNGNLYTTTATGGSNEIRVYGASYNYLGAHTMPTGNLTGVTCGPKGNLYFASQSGATSVIYKVDRTTFDVLDTIPIQGVVEALQFASDGNILVGLDDGLGVKRVQASSPSVVVSSISDAEVFERVSDHVHEREQVLEIPLEGLVVRAHGGDGVVHLVRDAGRHDAERGHLLALHERDPGLAQLGERARQLSALADVLAVRHGELVVQLQELRAKRLLLDSRRLANDHEPVAIARDDARQRHRLLRRPDPVEEQ